MSDSALVQLLVVDDEPDALDLIRRLLKRIGFDQVDTATDAFSALTMMHENAYGAVISDWNMPEMSGLQLVRAIRHEKKLKKTPFIMTSIDGDFDRVRLARESGVNAFLIKPFDLGALRSKLRDILGALPHRKLRVSLDVEQIVQRYKTRPKQRRA